jgi:hypothetical protein
MDMNYRAFLSDREITVHTVRVSAAPVNRVWDGKQRPVEQAEDACYISFDMEKAVCLEIEMEADFLTYELRPLSLSLPVARRGRRLAITVDQPCHFVLEIDGSHHALHVFCNPPSVKPAGEILYYGPGEHKAGLIWLQSGQSLYLDEGAVVYGVVYVKDAENVRIMGRGVLDASCYRRGNDDGEGGRDVIDALLARGFTKVNMKYHGNLVLDHCKNCLVEGVILRDAPMWSTIIRNDSEDITIDNIKIIGQWRYNSDGINICTSRRVTVKKCFIRSFDDCVIARGAYLEGETGNVEDLCVENCVLWCDWGKALEVWCGHKPTAIRRVLFKRNALIHLSIVAMDVTVWYGSEQATVDDIRYEELEIDTDSSYRPMMLECGNGVQPLNEVGYLPYAVSIGIERLGKMVDLGSQRCEEGADLSSFSIYFGNIRFQGCRIYGPADTLPVRVWKWSSIHTLKNITAANCDFALPAPATYGGENE